jgi:hypothetical protein
MLGNYHPLLFKLSVMRIASLSISQVKTLTLGGALLFQIWCICEEIIGASATKAYTDLVVKNAIAPNSTYFIWHIYCQIKC